MSGILIDDYYNDYELVIKSGKLLIKQNDIIVYTFNEDVKFDYAKAIIEGYNRAYRKGWDNSREYDEALRNPTNKE